MRGIYRITCVPTGKCYVGKGAIKSRFQKHRQRMRAGNHENKYLQADWQSYGEDAFVFEVIAQYDDITDGELDEAERYYISQFGSFNNGYNQTLGGKGSDGFRHSEDTKRTHSERIIGRYSGVKNPFFGRQHSEETRNKISEANRGRLKGISKSPEQRCKMSANNAKSVPIIVDGTTYPSMTEAARSLGVDRKTIAYRVNSENFRNYYIA